MNDMPRPFLASRQVSPLLRPQEPADTRSAIEEVAVQTGTPVEVLYAMGEAGGASTPGEFQRIARQAAQTLGPRFKAGESVEDVVRSFSGGDDTAVREFMSYARQINRQLYPDDWEGWDERRGTGDLLARGAADYPREIIRGVGRGMQMLGMERAGEGLVRYAESALGQSDAENERDAAIAERTSIGEEIWDGVIRAIPGIAGDIGAGAAGAFAGAKFGALAGPKGAVVGGVVGAIAGSAASIFPAELASSWDAADRGGRDVADGATRAEIAGAAVAKSIAQTLFPAGVAATLMRPLNVAAEATVKSVAKRAAQGAAVGSLTEGTAETLATFIDAVMFDPETRAALDERDIGALGPLLVERHGREAIVSFGVGALMGAGIGGPVGAVDRARVNRKIAKDQGAIPDAARPIWEKALVDSETVTPRDREIFLRGVLNEINGTEARLTDPKTGDYDSQGRTAAQQRIYDRGVSWAQTEAEAVFRAAAQQAAPPVPQGPLAGALDGPGDPENPRPQGPLESTVAQEAPSPLSGDMRPGERVTIEPVDQETGEVGLAMQAEFVREELDSGSLIFRDDQGEFPVPRAEVEQGRTVIQRRQEEIGQQLTEVERRQRQAAEEQAERDRQKAQKEAEKQAAKARVQAPVPPAPVPAAPLGTLGVGQGMDAEADLAADAEFLSGGMDAPPVVAEATPTPVRVRRPEEQEAQPADEPLDPFFVPPPQEQDSEGPGAEARGNLIRAMLRNVEAETNVSLTVPERRAIIDRLEREGGDARDAIVDELTRTIQNETSQPVVADEDESLPFGDPVEDAVFGGEPEAAQDGGAADEAAGRGGAAEPEAEAEVSAPPAGATAQDIEAAAEQTDPEPTPAQAEEKAETPPARPAAPAGPRVIVNEVGRDGLTDAERRAGKPPLDLVTVKDAYGDSHRVSQMALDGDKPMLRRYNQRGEPIEESLLARGNIDTDGTKVADTWSDRPVIGGGRDADQPMKSQTAVRTAINRRGQKVEDFDIRAVAGGFIGVRKTTAQAEAPAPEAPAAAPEPAQEPAPEPEATTAPTDSDSAIDAALRTAVAAGPVEHTTGKGKKLTGYVAQGLTKEQAKEVDPFTFAKDGGFFLRELYVRADLPQDERPAAVETSAPEAAETDAPGFAPLRPGYERVMVGGQPSTDQTRLTDDGFVVRRSINETTVIDPQGVRIFAGTPDVAEAKVNEVIDGARSPEGGGRRPFVANPENFPFEDSEAGNPGPRARRWLEAATDEAILAAPNMGLSENWLRTERKRRKIGEFAERQPEPPAPEPAASGATMEAAGFTWAEKGGAWMLPGEGRKWVIRPHPGGRFKVLRFHDQVGDVAVPTREIGIFGTDGEAIQAVQQDRGEAAVAAPAPEASTQIESKDARAPEAQQTASPAQPSVEAAILAGVQAGLVRHLTKKGHKLSGYVVKGITEAQAQEVDTRTFRRDDGWFIRETNVIGRLPEGSRPAKFGAASPEFGDEVRRISRMFRDQREDRADHYNHDLTLTFNPGPEVIEAMKSLHPSGSVVQPANTTTIFVFPFSDLPTRRAFIDALEAFAAPTAAPATPAATAETAGPTAAPEPAAAPSAAAEPKRQSLSSLSKKEQDRGAFLRARIADRLKNQTNTGVDPAILQDAIELAGLYIKDGYRKFRALLNQVAEDMGMTPQEAEPWVRVAYNEARDNLELDGQDVADMDDSRAVLAEARKVRIEESKKPAENDTSEGQTAAPETGETNDVSPQADDQGSVASPGAERGDGVALGAEGGVDADSGGRAEGGRTDEDGNADDRLEPGVVGSGPAVPQEAQAVRSGESPGNFVIARDFPLGEGTDGQKITANMAALRLVKSLDAENRYATPEEQRVLARYVGWGGLKRVFDPRETGKTNQWGRAQAELKELVTREEYAAIRRSTENAHFTSRGVVSAMWGAMRRFGFDGGRALEPTVGSGNFLGLMPNSLAGKTEWYAAELDNVTGAIARHLYPDATVLVGQGFQDAPFAPGSMDVAIGNPPFGSDVISSPLHPEIPPMSIHNYIIAKTGLLLREGGIMGMVVTNRFMDLPNPYARSYLARNFDFIGAVRLPNTAFKANAGTEVTTDIVWFQKRAEGEPRGDLSWLDSGVTLPGTDVTLNRYFAENPDMMLGRPGMDGTMRGAGAEFTLHDDGRYSDAALDQALAKLKAALPERTDALQNAVVEQETASAMAVGDFLADANGEIVLREIDGRDGTPSYVTVTETTPWGPGAMEMQAIIQRLEQAQDAATNGTMDERAAALESVKAALGEAGVLSDKGARKKTPPTGFGKALIPAVDALLEAINAKTPIFGRAQREAIKTFRAELGKKALGPTKLDALKRMLDLRRQFIDQLRAEREDAPNIEKMRAKLRGAYNSFVKDHGFINSPKNAALMQDRPGIEFGLEESYKPADKAKGIAEAARPASILRKRLIEPYKAPERAESAADGIHISLRERGRLDLPYIASLTGRDIAAVKAELTTGDKPLAFYDPRLEEYVIADEYLSGNLAAKISEAERAGMNGNIRALRAAMPPKKTKEQIVPSIRSQWLPPAVIEDFLAALGVGHSGVNVSPAAGRIFIEGAFDSNLTAFGEQFRTERRRVSQILEAAITGKTITVMDRTADDKQIKNVQATEEANLAVQRMSDEFQKWAYLNPDRTQQIVDAFNEKVNVIVERKFDGVSYLRTVGANPHITLRDSQKNGAWRMIQQPRTLMHHVVGAGKTMTAITAVMERKRLGLSKKSLIVVPNHIVEQWGREFRELYPGANILVADKKDFEGTRRRRMFARIASGDYDAIIIGHSQIRQIENNPDEVRAVMNEQIDALESALNEARASGKSKRTAAQIQKQLDKLQEKLDTLNKSLQGDDIGITFADMGIDNVVVDEAHEFKNLEYATGGERLVGMNSPVGSQRAFDLYVKLRGLQARDGATHFLTGTPVSNSLVEIYTMMKYLGLDTLKSMNLEHFDAWSSTFIKDEKRFEYTPAMTLKERRVIRGVVNAEALARIYKGFADILMRPDVERIYAAQMEAQNKRDGSDLPTRFPTPKVKGGGRQLVMVKSGPVHEEFTQYLVMRAEGISRNPPKDYAATDNMLWVLSDARKASIDIRTIDRTLGRLPNSKVVAAGDSILGLYHEFSNDRGTQLVFADSSVPMAKARKDLAPALIAGWKAAGLTEAAAKERVAADKGKPALEQYEAITDEIDRRLAEGEFNSRQQDRAEEWMDGEEAGDLRAMATTSDFGFSFYDDLKAYLVEQGIPESEVTFIHDHDTPQRKSDLFAAMNAGEMRVLIGSTFKMGAGMNVQERIVGIHHIDAPWRPSDMEQREGRGIRQGNELYKADPEGFELTINAYTMEKSADTVLWQVLERKAAGIEGFMRSTSDTVMEEGEGDADSYAAFMAQSTGNQVFIDKMKAEKELTAERAAISNVAMIASEAEAWVQDYPRTRANRQDYIRGYSSAAKMEAHGDEAGQTYRDYEDAMLRFDAAKEAHDLEVERVRAANEALPKGQKKALLPKFEMPRPAIYPEGSKLDPWAAKVKAAVEAAASSQAGYESHIKIDGIYELEISTPGTGSDSLMGAEITASIVARAQDGRTYGVHTLGKTNAKAPLESRALMQAVRPENIKSVFEGMARRERNRLSNMEAMKPEMEAKAAAKPDYRRLRRLEQDVNRLSGQVRVAEVRAAKDRIGKPNRFAQMDNKGRDLRAESSENAPVYAGPENAGFTFDFEGKTFRAPWAAKDGRIREDGETYERLWMAMDARDGDRVLVEFRARQYGDKETPPAGMVRVGDTSLHIKPESTYQINRAAPAAREMRPLASAAPIPRERLRQVSVALNEALRTMNVRANVRVVEAIVGALGQRIAGRAKGAEIQVSAEVGEAGALGVLRHEVIHVLRDAALWGKPYGLFGQAEWRALVAAARANKAIMDLVNAAYPDLSETARLEEAVAEMFREWAAGMDARSTLGRAFQRIREFFRALASALNGEGFDTAGRVMQRIADGDLGARHRARDGKGRFVTKEARGLNPWSTQVLEALTGRLRPEQTLTLGPVPEIVQRLGGRGSNLVMAAGKLRKVRKDHPEVSIEAIARLPDLIANPVFVLDNPGAQRTGDRLFVTDIVTGDDSALVASVKRVGRDDAGNATPVVVTIYGKDRFTQMMREAANGDRVLYVRGEREGSGYKHTGASSLNAPLSGTMSSLRASNRILTPRRVFKDGGPPRPEGAREMRFPLARDDASAEAREATVINRAVRAGSNTLTDLMGGKSDTYNLLALVPGRALFAELGKELPSARAYLRTKEEMDATRNQWHAKTDEVVRGWQKAISEAGGNWVPFSGKRKRAAKELADLMHDATIAGQDPSARFKAPRRTKEMRDEDYQSLLAEKRAEYDALNVRYRALPQPLQGVFTTVRDTFREQANEFEAAVADAAAKAMNVQADRARRRHQEELQQIRDEGLTGEALKEAEGVARRRLTSEIRRLEWNRAARIRQLRLKFEANRVEDPYFPLMRWGNYFATVRDEDGKVVSFSKFESVAKQEAFRKEMERDGLTVETGVMGTDADMSRYVDPGFVADIQDMMRGDAGAGTVLDAIWQRWLETLPDFSIRKSRIHRKGTPGFDGDALRAFAHQMFHGGHQLARLKYGMDLTEHLESMRSQSAMASDPNRAGMIVNEMEKRHAWTMNPTGGAWATFFTSAAFVWYLGITPAAAMVNLSQTTVVGIPVLTAGVEGATVGRTTRHLTRALRDFTAGKGWAQTAARLTNDERAALEEAYRRGTIDKSHAHDIAAVAESGVEYSEVRERIMRPIAFFFHHSERMNREVTFLAAYRMAKESGLDHDAAMQKASDLTWKTHFDYSGSSKPRFMQSDAGKVLFVFRNFQINMVYRLWRDLHQTLKGKSEAERKEARAQLVGITASMFLHAGITGTWGYALMMMLVGLFFEGGKDEVEEELKRGIVETFGPGAGGLLLKGVPGNLIGADLSRRIGMPELWWRSPDRQLEGEAAYQFWLTELVGAVPSIALGMFRGLQWAGEGDIWRGVETAGPKFLRDQMRSIRYLQEGVTTRSGEPVIEDLTPQQALVQAIGFTPAQVSERYEMNRRMRNIETRVAGERSRILRDVYDEIKQGGPISAGTMERIQDFNRKNPTWIITSSTVRQSIRSRQNMSDQMEGGLRLTPRLDGVIRSQMAPAIYG